MVEINIAEFQHQVEQMFDHVKEVSREAVDTVAEEIKEEVKKNLLTGYVDAVLDWHWIKPRYEAFKKTIEKHDMKGHVLYGNLLNSLTRNSASITDNDIQSKIYIEPLIANYEAIQEFSKYGGTAPRSYFQPAIDFYSDLFDLILMEEIQRVI